MIENEANGINELYGKGWDGDYGKSVKKIHKALGMIRKTMIPNKEYDDPVSAGVLENHFPHGVSAKTLDHLASMIRNGKGDG